MIVATVFALFGLEFYALADPPKETDQVKRLVNTLEFVSSTVFFAGHLHCFVYCLYHVLRGVGNLYLGKTRFFFGPAILPATFLIEPVFPGFQDTRGRSSSIWILLRPFRFCQTLCTFLASFLLTRPLSPSLARAVPHVLERGNWFLKSFGIIPYHLGLFYFQELSELSEFLKF